MLEILYKMQPLDYVYLLVGIILFMQGWFVALF